MLTQYQIEFLDKVCPNIWTEHDGVVDVSGNVAMYSMGLTRIPVQFGKVTGFFSCIGNKLTSLEGCPSIVGWYFDCSCNQLTSLEGGPVQVRYDYSCHYNQLTNLIGVPVVCNNNFYCESNQLTTLEGGPKEVVGSYSCIHNQLVNLIGAPAKCNAGFYCQSNQLTTLEGCPRFIRGNLNCSNNPKLSVLYGLGRVQGDRYYDTPNDLNELIIKLSMREQFDIIDTVADWIKSNNRLEFLLYVPEEVRAHFSPRILQNADSGLYNY